MQMKCGISVLHYPSSVKALKILYVLDCEVPNPKWHLGFFQLLMTTYSNYLELIVRLSSLFPLITCLGG